MKLQLQFWARVNVDGLRAAARLFGHDRFAVVHMEDFVTSDLPRRDAAIAALLERVLVDEPAHGSAQQILDKLHERKAAAQIKLDPLKEKA